MPPAVRTGPTARPGPTLGTERLILRRWRPADRDPFAELNADPVVMEHFLAPLTRAESDTMVTLIEENFTHRGYSLWALEVRATGEFIGFTGLERPSFEAAFTPAVEIGWRLARPAWGHGYATEAARAVVGYAFRNLHLADLVSFTATTNVRSQAVMRRLGMTHDPRDDFDHPRLPVGHRLRRHVLYRLSQARWAGAGAG